MPGKQARVLCPVCQEPIPPDETECENCGAFVIDEAVVRLSRAFGLDREKALKLFEAGFRHPKQLQDRDPNRVLEKGEIGLLFICTNCGGFVAGADLKCPRCAAEFEAEPEAPAAEEEDILDLVFCSVCGADNDPKLVECEICGAPLREMETPTATPTEAAASSSATAPAKETVTVEKTLQKVDDFLEDLEASTPVPTIRPNEPPRPEAKRPLPKPSEPKAPVLPKPSSSPSHIPPQPKSIPTSARPIPRETSVAVERPQPVTAMKPTVAPQGTPRPPETVGPESKAHAAPPTKRVASMPAKFIPRKKVRASRLEIAPETAGGLVLAAGAGLILAGFLGQSYVGLGIAALLVGLDLLILIPFLKTEQAHLSGLDGALLAAAAAFGLTAAAMNSGPAGTAPEVVLAVAGTIPFAWASRRLLASPPRVLLAIASSIPLIGYAIRTAVDPRFAGTLSWAIGIFATAPWPAALAAAEIRRRQSTSVLRRGLVRAERDLVQRNYEHSLEEYDRAIAATRAGVPGADIPWYGKGATLVLLGRYEEALQAIDMALDINPRNEVAWLNKGNALTKMGRLVDAMRCFNAAIKVNPDYEVAWNNKGNTFARLEKYEEALRCYERAIEIDPGYRMAWVNKGFVLTKLGRFEEATSCADRALRLDVGQPEPA